MRKEPKRFNGNKIYTCPVCSANERNTLAGHFKKSHSLDDLQDAILKGDTRRKKHVIPLGFKLINVYLDAGFKLRELVTKRQHNCKTTGFWYAN